MSWLGRRFDHLGSAAFGGAGGIGFSQAPAFTQAYLQRLGGHVDEARLTIERVADGEILPWLGAENRREFITELSTRLETLESLRNELLEAPAMLRPLVALQHGDWTIARRAAGDFVPAVPLDPASLVWTGIGIVVAVVLYECCKTPAWWVRRRRRTRSGDAASGRTGPD